MQKLTSLSIFFPAFNDAQSIVSLVSKAYFVGKKVAEDLEVIVVDDGSTDDTEDVLKKLKNKFKDFKIINHGKNFGYGGALQSGFKNATKEFVFYTDGDGQYDPLELEKLAQVQMKNNADVVNGFKIKRSDSVIRLVAGNIYNRIVHLIYGLPISDVDCDFRLIRRSFLEKIKLTSNSGLICLELVLSLKKAGAKFSEVGVNHYNRKYGKSQFINIKNLFLMFADNLEFFIRNLFSFLL